MDMKYPSNIFESFVFLKQVTLPQQNMEVDKLLFVEEHVVFQEARTPTSIRTFEALLK